MGSNLDIGKNVEAHNRLLATLDNPRHRRIIANYKRHAILEVTGNWEQIFVPEMTVEEPVYIITFGPIQGKILRGPEVHQFYKDIAAVGANVIVVTEEQLVVGDAGLGQESFNHQFLQGHAIRALGEDIGDSDLDKWFHIKQMVCTFWPYDERARLIGEHGAAIGPPEIREIPEDEVVTLQEAREKLMPQLEPLPQYTPVMA